MSDHGREIPDVSDRLADLAGTAGWAAVLPQAQAIRRRGRRRVLRQRALVVALAVVVFTAGAVGSTFVAPAHPPQLPAGTPTPDRTPSPHGSPDPTATPTSPTPARPPRSKSTSPVPTWCRRPGIVVSAGGQNSGAGHRSMVLVFTTRAAGRAG